MSGFNGPSLSIKINIFMSRVEPQHDVHKPRVHEREHGMASVRVLSGYSPDMEHVVHEATLSACCSAESRELGPAWKFPPLVDLLLSR